MIHISQPAVPGENNLIEASKCAYRASAQGLSVTVAATAPTRTRAGSY